MALNLYLLTRSDPVGYDEYEAVVVAAGSPDEAIRIHPDGKRKWDAEREDWYWDGPAPVCERNYDGQMFGSWAKPIMIDCRLIGVAHRSVAPGVVMESFNAG